VIVVALFYSNNLLLTAGLKSSPPSALRTYLGWHIYLPCLRGLLNRTVLFPSLINTEKFCNVAVDQTNFSNV